MRLAQLHQDVFSPGSPLDNFKYNYFFTEKNYKKKKSFFPKNKFDSKKTGKKFPTFRKIQNQLNCQQTFETKLLYNYFYHNILKVAHHRLKKK